MKSAKCKIVCSSPRLCGESFRSELPKEPDVVFDEAADVLDGVLSHGDAFDAQAEGPAGVFFGVDAAVGEDVGMDHAAAAQLDPALLVLEPHVHLGRGLGERE